MTKMKLNDIINFYHNLLSFIVMRINFSNFVLFNFFLAEIISHELQLYKLNPTKLNNPTKLKLF